MSAPGDAQRLAKRGARLARQASACFAQAADAATDTGPVAAGARVVATLTYDPADGPAVLARTIHDVARLHGPLDVLLVTDNPTTTTPMGVQEDHDGTTVQRGRAPSEARGR